jgi:DNA-binding PadR family transcriptional regulator
MFYAYKTFMPIKRLKRLNTKESLWIYAISLLKDGPRHAYALKKEIEEKFGFGTGNVTVYKVLYLLSRRGYVTKQKKDRKVIYSVTEKGIKALDEAKEFYKKQVDRL